jgi:HPt (histidine-containing phosphotransfer) domain-containing protein
LGQAAHSAKSSSANIGARKLSAVAAHLEQASGAAPETVQQADIAKLRDEFEETAKVLRAFLDESRPIAA